MSFSGYPKTLWQGERDMVLLEEIAFCDGAGREWKVPTGAQLNGATIPRPLWSTVGSPYVGKYRRASVIHDFFVGELSNPDVSEEDRKKADRMFYEACLEDGCSPRFAGILYAGVCFGSWMARDKFLPLDQAFPGEERFIEEEDASLCREFWNRIDLLKEELESGNLDAIERVFPLKEPPPPPFLPLRR